MLSIEGMETCNSVQIDKFWGHNFPTDRYYLACDVMRQAKSYILFELCKFSWHYSSFTMSLPLFFDFFCLHSVILILLLLKQQFDSHVCNFILKHSQSVFTAHSADYDYMLIPAALLRSDNSSGNDKTGHCSHYGQARADSESPGHRTLVGLVFVRPLSALCCEIRSSVRTPQRPAVS